MISLIHHNKYVFVWNAEDWQKLRKEHRIIGNLSGTPANVPFQNAFNSLPSVLLEEEATLLIEKKIAKLFKYKTLTPSKENIEKYDNYTKKNKEEQVEYIVAEKKRNITEMIDKIVEGKRKKQMLCIKQPSKEGDNSELNKEEILKAELEKVEHTPLSHSLVHTFTEDPWMDENNFINSDGWEFPKSASELLRYRVFKDLWEKGFYITCGQKFGGDFLVYPGDPVLYHAHYIVLCLDKNKAMSWTELQTHSRVGSSSRKTFVLASSLDNLVSISYFSLQFHGLIPCVI